ncbi:MAG: universal stress protein [Steroidobacteraceae bacterium]|jgi:nucleotide-binding universal stress UspA family protein
MIHNILVGYDGSEAAANALTFAADIARAFGSSVHVLAVVRPPEFGGMVETEAVIEQSRQHYQNMLRGVQSKLAREHFKTHVHIAVGHPAEQIVRFAEAHDIDYIIVGRRGHTLFERWLIGSVARQVIAYAHCAVTVVRKAAT